MHRPPRRARQRAITLLETCCALAVMAALAALAVPVMADFTQRLRLQAAADLLGADIAWARSEAIARNRTLRLTLGDTDRAGCYAIHEAADGTHCDCGPGPADCGSQPALRTQRPPGTLALGSNVKSVVFDPRRGTVSPTATFRWTAPGGLALHQVVNLVGRIRRCSPHRSMGLPPC